MSTKSITFQNYDAETGQFFTDTKTCTVVTEEYKKETLGNRDGVEYWYVVEGSVDLKWFNVRGNVHLILADGCTLTADKKTYDYAAINVESADEFYIYGQSEGTGKIVAKGGYYGAAIGGDEGEVNGKIVINGGVVEATGGDYAAGIGSGRHADSSGGQSITINGGKVIAEGGYKGAGIGGGNAVGAGNITITGGTVTATAGDYASGIGGGHDGSGHDITITGGTVNATGAYCGSGIGGGYMHDGYNIAITGGNVTAKGADYGAGIGGGGGDGAGYSITISDCTVKATGGYKAAGIGGGNGGSGSDISITDASVTASGGDYASGIGGGNKGSGYDITLSGSTVTATGDEGGAGVGGGYDGSGHDITINGGKVTATGGGRGSGIGGGTNSSGYDIEINGGEIKATGGGTSAAGIGGGAGGISGELDSSAGYNITINDGTVTAKGTSDSSGIGGAGDGQGKNITINGGVITADGANGAGIGAGECGYGGYIYINGGTISATSDGYAAGIGSGRCEVGSNIYINGGLITEASSKDGGTGIGGGDAGGGDVTINGGDITAIGGSDGAGIGGGSDSEYYVTTMVTINGGNVNASSGSDGYTAIGAQTDSSASVVVKEAITVKAGKSSASDNVEHTDDENISSKLSGKRYIKTTSSHTTLDTEFVYTASATTCDVSGYVGDGGYYSISCTGGLINTDYIVTFENINTTGNGGAIYNEGTVSLANVTFSKCYCSNGNGGAVSNHDGVLELLSATFTENLATYGGLTYSGGAIYADGGSVSVDGGTFSANSAWYYGGAVYCDGVESCTLSNVYFSGNTARNGGAVVISNSELTILDSDFADNIADRVGTDGGNGGAILLKSGGELNLYSASFRGNTATNGGAIYVEEGSTLNLCGYIELGSSSDTIVNDGTINWDISLASSNLACISDYSLLGNNGKLMITVSASSAYSAIFTLANNAYDAAGQTFTITGVEGQQDRTITVGGETVEYNKMEYTLFLENGGRLALDVKSTIVAQGRQTISDTQSVTNTEINNLPNSTFNGGVYEVTESGNLTIASSSFTGNNGNLGGVIYNSGTISLDDVTFHSNISNDGNSGAVYNAQDSTFNIKGDVILSTDSDKIYNCGDLVWNISSSGCGYISDWTRLVNDGGTLTVSGTKDDRCGQYVLAGNAASSEGTVFTVKGENGEISLTVGGDVVAINNTYFAVMTLDTEDTLILTIATKQVTVESGERFKILDGTVYNQDGSVQYANGGVFLVKQGGELCNDGAASFSGANVSNCGGIIYCDGGTVTLDSITFSGNSASVSGGAIHCSQDKKGYVSISNSKFQNNQSANGAAIYSYESGSLLLNNVEFTNNVTSSFGNKEAAGAIYSGTETYLDNVTFSGNSTNSRNGGGAITLMYCKLHIRGDVVLATSSDTVYNNDGNLIWEVVEDKHGYVSNYALIKNTSYALLTVDAYKGNSNASYVLASNAASADQQTFYVGNYVGNQETFTVNGKSKAVNDRYLTIFTDGNDELRLSVTERAVVDGGKVQFDAGLVFTTAGTAYEGNGGAIEVKNGGRLVAAGSDDVQFAFTDSVTTGNGGAIYINDGVANLTKVTFSGNTATLGGAIYLAENTTLTVTDAIFNGNSSSDGQSGAVYISQGATLNVIGSLTLSTSTDTICNYGTLNWIISMDEAESGEYELCDQSLLYGTGDLVIIIDDGTVNEDTRVETEMPLGEGTPALNRFIIKNIAGEIIGELDDGDTVQYKDSYLGLVVEDGQVKLSIVDKPKNLTGDAEGVTWDSKAENSMLNLKSQDTGYSLGITTEGQGVNFYALTAGSYEVSVKNSLGNTWSDGLEITSEYDASAPTQWVSKANGQTDLFFANANGIWGGNFKAMHLGIKDGWCGTGEKVSLQGKNKFADMFCGVAQCGNVLVLTNDSNGDALFLDDIYTAFPDIEFGGDDKSRLAEIDEIRAGAGDDIIDMTSQRYDYRGCELTIHGGSGNDVIWANNGKNILFGDAGNDRIIGGGGDDVIIGGTGNDSMHGGGGNDIFIFGENWGQDTVTQLASGSVTLWFASGSEENWNQSTMTYAEGSNSVTVSGVTDVTLKFGDDRSKYYDKLFEQGAFAENTGDNLLERQEEHRSTVSLIA